MKLQKIINIMEKFAPPELAEEWDNVGLLIGKADSDINKIMVSLDINNEVLDQAIENRANLIITHHPVIFKPLRQINDDLIIKIIKNDICVYSAHTNLDATIGGVNYILADALGLFECRQSGMLRYGNIINCSLKDFIKQIKQALNVTALRISGATNKNVSKVAVLGGSGGSFVIDAANVGCDVFVTGEASYHDAQLADSLGITLISAGHFETENLISEKLKKYLETKVDVEVLCSTENNIYTIL